MADRLHALAIRTPTPEASLAFWGGLLGWSREGPELDPSEEAPFRLAFEADDEPRTGLNQLHFHLTSNSAPQAATVARALELGASHLDVGQLPQEDHVVLSDPDGNEFCVIDRGDRLAARLGSRTHPPRGSRRTGRRRSRPRAAGSRSRGVGRRSTRGTGGTGRTSSWPPTSSTWRSSVLWGSGRAWSGAVTGRSRWRTRTGTSSACVWRSALQVDGLGGVEADHEATGVRRDRGAGQPRDHHHRGERGRDRPGRRLPEEGRGPAGGG